MQIIISKNVEEALNELLTRYKTMREVHNLIHNSIETSSSTEFITNELVVARDWYAQQKDNELALMLFFTGNYLVERTPEEKFNDKYASLQYTASYFDAGFLQGMKWVAQQFNLKVNGVDSNE